MNLLAEKIIWTAITNHWKISGNAVINSDTKQTGSNGCVYYGRLGRLERV